ncbi:GNAT family N-acetyltransferase [Nocardia cyriacigeorgica]|uniref:GNAT family N-acetyltransferase n=1 Tax=Nocardia cyriacigeorgica TaxID=135487 RepID=UPI00030494D0|nr:GNAT family N-acetyltransferase [Nocardia cyriacigeorgica]
MIESTAYGTTAPEKEFHPDMTTRLEHNVADTRFEIYIDDTLAGYADYSEREDTKVRDFHHTMTFPEFRGRGVAAQVVEYALADSREHGFSVVPTCWYVDQYIGSHPEYADLVK